MMLKVGDGVKVVKGLQARGIQKGTGAFVRGIKEWERGTVVVSLEFMPSGRKIGFQVRHRNVLSKLDIPMHTGDPTQKLVITKVERIPGVAYAKKKV